MKAVDTWRAAGTAWRAYSSPHAPREGNHHAERDANCTAEHMPVLFVKAIRERTSCDSAAGRTHKTLATRREPSSGDGCRFDSVAGWLLECASWSCGLRMGGRVVEGGSLENCFRRKSNGGSNPSPSASRNPRKRRVLRGFVVAGGRFHNAVLRLGKSRVHCQLFIRKRQDRIGA
jgi:hypothetical protein